MASFLSIHALNIRGGIPSHIAKNEVSMMEGTSMILLVQKSGGFIVMIQFSCIPSLKLTASSPLKMNISFSTNFQVQKSLFQGAVKTPVSHL